MVTRGPLCSLTFLSAPSSADPLIGDTNSAAHLEGKSGSSHLLSVTFLSSVVIALSKPPEISLVSSPSYV